VRQKSRFDCADSQGRHLGVFLPRGTAVRGGDVLVAEDGSLIRVIAAPQPVLVITPAPDHGSAFDLTRAAYHLGNRHVPLQIEAGWVRYLHDHVLDDMVRGLGLEVLFEQAPFEPEAGAYQGGSHAHSHSHSHSHSHTHADGSDAEHGHSKHSHSEHSHS
jgi:urease accessory protein